MKKNFIIIIILFCISYVYFISFADEYGTDVEYIGQGFEEYTVTVPAKISPNGIGDVIVNGTWPSDRVVRVTSDQSVEMVNNLNVFNKKNIDINFRGIYESGSDTERKLINSKLLVGDFDSKVIFGDWKGQFNYNVEMVDSNLFYDKVYNKIFQADEVPTAMPKHIVIYENNSLLFVHDNNVVYQTEPDSLVFINNNTVQYDDMLFEISSDKTKFTAYNPATKDILAIWEVQIVNNKLDNTFPIEFRLKDVASNTRIILDDLQFVKVSDLSFSQNIMSNLNVEFDDGENPYSSGIYSDNCNYNYGICFFATGNDEIIVISLSRPIVQAEPFIFESGIYFPISLFDLNTHGDLVVRFSIDDNYDENNNVVWNTMDVINNKSVNYNGSEFVKVFDETYNENFYYNNINFIVNGCVIPFEFRQGSASGSVSLILYDMNEFDYGFDSIFLVKEPGYYNDVFFEEPGVYAYNYGKENLNYTITFSDDNLPFFENKLNIGSYKYKNFVLKFLDDDSVQLNQNTTFDFTVFGRAIKIGSRFVGIISKDGKSIKFYKELSSEWFNGENSDVTFVIN